MPVRTDNWLGAAALGAVVSWVQKRQNQTGKSLFGNLLASLGMQSDGAAVALIPAVVEAIPDLERMVPPQYRPALQGATDAGLGIFSMLLASQQGFGAIPTTVRRVIATRPVQTVTAAPITRSISPAVPSVSAFHGTRVANVANNLGTRVPNNLADSLTVSGW